MSLLELRDVEVVYQRRDGTPVPAVAGASLEVNAGEIVGLVGETGCGKSSLARAAVGLVPVTAGSVTFDGLPIHVLGRRARRPSERRLQLVFQNPYESNNPRRTVGSQVADAFAINGSLPRSSWRPRMEELLRRVGLPASMARRFPHQLSGGQRQRIAIARALASDPAMIVLDEPLPFGIPMAWLMTIKRPSRRRRPGRRWASACNCCLTPAATSRFCAPR